MSKTVSYVNLVAFIASLGNNTVQSVEVLGFQATHKLIGKHCLELHAKQSTQPADNERERVV